MIYATTNLTSKSALICQYVYFKFFTCTPLANRCVSDALLNAVVQNIFAGAVTKYSNNVKRYKHSKTPSKLKINLLNRNTSKFIIPIKSDVYVVSANINE